MDPTNMGPDEHGLWGSPRPEPGEDSGADPSRPAGDDGTAPPSLGDPSTPAPARAVRVHAGGDLLTINPIDGSEIEPCPPGEQLPRPTRRGPQERAELNRAMAVTPPAGAAGALDEPPMLERAEERERLTRLLSRGRSVRLTGPSGAGRSTLLAAVADACEDLAPDGVVRLNGRHRTPTDLLYELYAVVFGSGDARYRPDRTELLAAVHDIGAVVVLDDAEFGGTALDEFLDATPECAFLISATPDVAAPSAGSHLEEVFLGGLGRTGSLELLERAVQRPLTEAEADWAADLWFASEGLPLRFVQAGALLRQSGRALPTLAEGAAPAALIAGGLSEAAKKTLRFAVALGGECPHASQLAALTGDTHGEAALGELHAAGLVTQAGSHHRLAAGVAAQLAAAGYADDATGHAHTAARHYAWWTGHPSVAPERVAQESDAILAALAALVSGRRPAHSSAAVLLARTAAPAFAAALAWNAWERTLRHGQEAARLAGEVAEDAYFHHELGVLALCTGSLDRARAALEASIGLRGVLADRHGAVAGRRALALVTDRARAAASAPAGGPAMGKEAVPGAAARADRPASGPGTPTAPLPPVPSVPGVPGDTAVTERIGVIGGGTGAASTPVATDATTALPAGAELFPTTPPAPPAAPPAAGTAGAAGAAAGGRRRVLPRLALTGTRRNVAAAGAGALLLAVLGTVVTLGLTSGEDEEPATTVRPGESNSQSDNPYAGDDNTTTDEPTPGHTGNPRRGETGSPVSPLPEETGREPSTPGDTGSPSTGDDPSSPGGSESPSTTSRPSSPTSRPPTTTKPPTTKPPTTKPPTTPPTTEPTPTPTTPTPTDDSSNTASGPATTSVAPIEPSGTPA